MHVVEARGLSVRYNNKVQALTNVDISVPEQSVMGIIGPNGSGKSTSMKAMLGLIDASGTTAFYGKPLPQVRNRVGYMPQHSSVDWNFPIDVANVVLMGTYGQLGWVRRPGAKEHGQAAAAMEATDIANLADRQIGELSGGQRQRVFLARMLAGEPDLLFMDEPFQGIDHVSQKAIMQVIHQLRRDGKTIVIVHHDLNTVPELCDHVTLLNSGKVVASGPVETTFTKDTIHKTYGSSVVIM